MIRVQVIDRPVAAGLGGTNEVSHERDGRMEGGATIMRKHPAI